MVIFGIYLVEKVHGVQEAGINDRYKTRSVKQLTVFAVGSASLCSILKSCALGGHMHSTTNP